MTLITVGLANDGQEVHASVRDTVVLKLPENPTTGVRWSLERLEGPAQLAGDAYEHPSSGGIGAAATRVLTLKPQRPGRIELRLKRWQEWEGETSVDATFSCAVEVES